jgi:DNA-binding NarL/FixJ family response regulator
MIRICIADPNPATRNALIHLLRGRLGTDGITEVGDVESLIRHLAESPPDLLLLDWRLYGSPAPETCILLQKAYPQLTIVLLSVDASDAEAARNAGALFIHKGAPPEEMIATLKPLFRIESSGRSSSKSSLKL